MSGPATGPRIVETGPGAPGWEDFVSLGERPSIAALPMFLGYGSAAHFLVYERGGRAVGRVTAAVNRRVPQDPACGDVGYLGHLVVPPRGGREMVSEALAWLSARGVGVVRAPVDLSTWYGNRVNLGPFDRPRFALEPEYGPEVVGLLVGFSERQRYYSTEVPQILGPVDAWRGHERRARSAGIAFRRLDPSRMDRELALVHGLIHRSFSAAFSFSRVDLDEFGLAMGGLLRLVEPELLIFAVSGQTGQEVGFAFGYRDPSDRTRLVVKTLGVSPEARGTGTGSALVARLHRAGHTLGCTSAIHALMNESSHSRAISAHGSQVFRRYVMLEKAF